MQQIHSRPGLRPGPHWGRSRRSPRPSSRMGRGDTPSPFPRPLDAYSVSFSVLSPLQHTIHVKNSWLTLINILLINSATLTTGRILGALRAQETLLMASNIRFIVVDRRVLNHMRNFQAAEKKT